MGSELNFILQLGPQHYLLQKYIATYTENIHTTIFIINVNIVLTRTTVLVSSQAALFAVADRKSLGAASVCFVRLYSCGVP